MGHEDSSSELEEVARGSSVQGTILEVEGRQ